jgi:hypothetical protein
MDRAGAERTERGLGGPGRSMPTRVEPKGHPDPWPPTPAAFGGVLVLGRGADYLAAYPILGERPSGAGRGLIAFPT